MKMEKVENIVYKVEFTEDEMIALLGLLQNPLPAWEGDEPDDVRELREDLFNLKAEVDRGNYGRRL